MRQLVWFTCCVLLLFSGYNALQTLLPQQRPTAGPLTIAAGYVAYAGAALLPPTAWRRWAFALCASSFALWVFSTDYSDTWLALASIACGAGSGIFWTNEGAWLSDNSQSQDQATTFSAVILIGFHLSTLAGQQIMFQLPTAIYWVALGMCWSSAILFLIAPSAFYGQSNDGQSSDGVAQRKETGTVQQVIQSGWIMLICEIALFGCGSALVWVGLARLLGTELYIGFAIFSISSIAGFILSVFAARYWELVRLTMLGAFVHIVCWSLLSILDQQKWLLYGIMFSVGIGNAFLNQAIVVKQTKMLPRSFSCQVALYCLVYASSSALLAWSLQAGLIAAITLGFSALAMQQFQN